MTKCEWLWREQYCVHLKKVLYTSTFIYVDMILMYALRMDGSEWTTKKKLTKVRRKTEFFLSRYIFCSLLRPPFFSVVALCQLHATLYRLHFTLWKLFCSTRMPSIIVRLIFFHFLFIYISSLVRNTKCKMWCWFTSSQYDENLFYLHF